MGLTSRSTGKQVLADGISAAPGTSVLALAGSPNVGKSTVFNALTGLRQHTGNWTGKTVATAAGTVRRANHTYLLADVPGTYSLCARSQEEAVARDFILFGGCDGVIAVCDALCLERNLTLVLQIAEYTPKVTVCVNLLDQAEKKGVRYDLEKLSGLLGLEIAPCAAKRGRGLEELMQKTEKTLHRSSQNIPPVDYGEPLQTALDELTPEIERAGAGRIPARFTAIKLLCGDTALVEKLESHFGTALTEDAGVNAALQKIRQRFDEQGITKQRVNDLVAEGLASNAAELCRKTRLAEGHSYAAADRAADRIITGRLTAFPILLALLALVFWITVAGANVPSAFLSKLLFSAEPPLYLFLERIGLPTALCELFVHGIYRVAAWVISVMLPPMAIFFPLFTLLEDVGFLPRIAYNLDRCFAACHACGKQALTMCMGFGCNAAGVVGCRIIDSPRERLIAILTNCFVPCNGRFPLLVTMISMFFLFGTGWVRSLGAALLLAAFIVLGILATFAASWLLSMTLLKGEPSAFTLELPPYRCPNIAGVLIRSFLDRTLFVLGRAVAAAAPAGMLIWLLANLSVGGQTLLAHCTGFLDPFARFFGMDGVILMAFILALPANEIVIPVMILAYMAGGSLTSVGQGELLALFTANGWTWSTALCVMLFSLMHWPCATTLQTVKKESGSLKWTALAAILPTLFGFIFCFAVNALSKLF